jgi:mannose-6-phosphate isomerase-like protein (cupin superfamily)
LKKSINLDKSEIIQLLKDDSSVTENEIQQTEDALIGFASAFAVKPDPELKDKILNKIRSLNFSKNNLHVLDLENLPILSESSNWLEWKEAVKDIQAPEEYDGIHLHTLESSDKRELFVAWVKEYVEEEVHTDLIESFILLEGTCECHITGEDGITRIVRMGEGDYITMQVGETHDVIITSLQPAKAILQWMKLSA